MNRVKRIWLGSAVAILALVSGSGGAMAGTFATVSATGVSFTGGIYSFDPWPCNSTCVSGQWSGMQYSGTLNDTAEDGHSTKAQAKVDGYGYATAVTLATDAGSRAVAQHIYAGADPAQTGVVQVCTVISLTPDKCATSATLRR